MNKKTAGDNIEVQASNWKFKGKAVEHFDEHIRKSVPLYSQGHDVICDLSSFFIKDSSIIYEIGCSTGTLSLKLAKHNLHKSAVQLIGIDIEQDMIDAANENLKKTGLDNVMFCVDDIATVELEKSDLIVCYYTIQFIPPALRQQIIDKIYQSLHWGGAFIMFERVRAPDARFQDILNTLYLDYKLKQGYSEEAIIGKIMSLKGVLEPFSTRGNIDMLKRAGFLDITSVQKYLSFEGFLAIK